MGIKLITPPATEPVTLAEAKLQCKVDVDLTADDWLLMSYITGARQRAESITRRALVSQQWKITGDRFPSPMAGRLTEYWLGQQWGMAGMSGVSQFLPTDRSGYGIVLPFPPLVSVDSINYIDPAGAQQTMPSGDYKVDSTTEPARIVPAYGKSWPGTRQEIGAVEITFTCGYGAIGDVPRAIKNWILLQVDHAYRYRGTMVEVQGKLEAIPDHLLDDYRVVTF